MGKKLTTDGFIKRARTVHGDRYDYSSVEYKNITTKVTIICPEHGEFAQRAETHLQGSVCFKCSYNERGKHRRLDKEEFIERARTIHGDRYDYSLVDYQDSKTKVIIICPEHGEFKQQAKNHLFGRGCHPCGLSRIAVALGTEEFIKRARVAHGETYDYSLVNYKESKTDVTIICLEHGEFKQNTRVHLKGGGCPECANNRTGKAPRLDKEEFIERARAIHGNRYDYSLVDYQDTHSKVTIICPEHGEFRQDPANHCSGGQGCPDCGNEAMGEKRRLDNEKFIERAHKAHGDRYDYSLVDYKDSQTDVTIICLEHGEFTQVAASHLVGSGCPDCGYKVSREALTLSTKGFIERAHKTHGDRYDYSMVDYQDTHSKVTIICPEHGEFRQAASSHLAGKGCSACANYGLDYTAPAILYYLRIDDGGAPLYKIGITNKTVAERFSGTDFAKMTVLKEWEYSNGYDASKQEQFILDECSEHRYDGSDVLNRGGNTELFDTDVLGLDTMAITKG